MSINEILILQIFGLVLSFRFLTLGINLLINFYKRLNF